MANFNINKVILGGRLTADPELKVTPNGVPVTSFSIAVNRRFKGDNAEVQADFINVTAWRQLAELVSKFFHKGSSICVVGSIQTRSWTDQNGAKRYATDVIADEVLFVDSKSESSAASPAPSAYPSSYMPDSYTHVTEAPNLEPIGDDDSLPF